MLPFYLLRKNGKLYDFANINFLVKETYLPFASTVLDEEIECIVNNPRSEYWKNKSYIYSYDRRKIFPCRQLSRPLNEPKRVHIKKIANIVNDIQTNKYVYDFRIPIYCDYDEETNQYYFDFDSIAMYHLRAFHFCQKDPPVLLLYSRNVFHLTSS